MQGAPAKGIDSLGRCCMIVMGALHHGVVPDFCSNFLI